jgi:hypothetical protein
MKRARRDSNEADLYLGVVLVTVAVLLVFAPDIVNMESALGGTFLAGIVGLWTRSDSNRSDPARGLVVRAGTRGRAERGG